MNSGSMKNIVVLKDLPSNLVEEAIIFLKENHKLKSLELIDSDIKKKKGKTSEKSEKPKQEDSKEYIVNEAQMLIADYISKLENKSKKEDISYKKLKKKYQILKKISISLTIGLLASIFANFII